MTNRIEPRDALTKEFLTEHYLNQDKSIPQIAKEMGYGDKTIEKYLKRFSLRKGKNGRKQKIKGIESLLPDFYGGMSMKDMATKHQINIATVGSYLKKLCGNEYFRLRKKPRTAKPKVKKEKPKRSLEEKMESRRLRILATRNQNVERLFGSRRATEYLDELQKYKYQCESCGKEGVARISSLRERDCRCQRKYASGEISLALFTHMKRGAKKSKDRVLEWNLSPQFLWNLYLSQNRRCALTNRVIFLKSPGRTASLDRIVSTRGYTEDNVQWIHVKMQALKKDLDERELLVWCEDIIQKTRGNNRRNGR